MWECKAFKVNSIFIWLLHTFVLTGRQHRQLIQRNVIACRSDILATKSFVRCTDAYMYVNVCVCCESDAFAFNVAITIFVSVSQSGERYQCTKYCMNIPTSSVHTCRYTNIYSFTLYKTPLAFFTNQTLFALFLYPKNINTTVCTLEWNKNKRGKFIIFAYIGVLENVGGY